MMEEKSESTVDIHKLQEAARNASAYYREQHSFQRNVKLTRLVHAIFNAAQFITALTVELFHHLHHYVHRNLREQDPTIPNLPEERNPAFYVYPICMCISLVLAVLWLFTKIPDRNPGKIGIACALSSLLMIIGGLFSMRHAEIHINLEEVSDKELLDHPIFIHNFVLCIISIFGMNLYLLQAWILFDTWRWRKKNESDSSSSYETEMSEHTENTLSSNYEYQDPEELDAVAVKLKDLPKPEDKIHINPEDEPVILYCCCLDCWNYIKESLLAKNPTHEFQVVHVM